MNHVFHLPHIFDVWEQVQTQFRQTDQALIGFDFDGTLTPIAHSPHEASLAGTIRDKLRDLASMERVTIAVLSGRSFEDLSLKINLPSLVLAGDHGLRIRLNGEEEFSPTQSSFTQEVIDLGETIRKETSHLEGVVTEIKEFTITVHYRKAPGDIANELGALLIKLAEGSFYNVSPGRKCWELKPTVNWNKGEAFRWIRQHATKSQQSIFQLYVGDDATDEDVFQVLSDEGFPVLVNSDEKSDKTAAKYCLNHQHEIEELLDKLRKLCAEK